MLCSAAELELSEDHDGIIELPDDAPVGVALRALRRARRSRHRRRRDAEPPRRDRRRRHRARSRRGRPRHAEDAGAESLSPARSTARPRVHARFRPRRRASLPGLRLAARARRDQRPLARMDAEAAAGDWPEADQRARRHHQLHHLRSRPPAARVRLRQGRRRSDSPPRSRRRKRARARRQDLRARREHGRRSPMRTASSRSPASWAASIPAATRRRATC